jgi:ABC-type uncharacterized transport system substrate-binding protein
MIVRRREFIALVGGALAWPIVGRAQQPTMPLVGYLNVGSPEAVQLPGFRKGLSEMGYVEGRTVAIEYRWANDDYNRLPELVADLVRRRVAIIAAPGLSSALAAKAATTTIPVVFLAGGDAVEAGLVTSLGRPGGNVTGINSMSTELGAKRLALMYELLPRATSFAVLINPNIPNIESAIKGMQAAAAAIGRPIEILTASTGRELDATFVSLGQKRVNALVVSPAVLFDNHRVQLTTLAVRHGVPTIFSDRAFADIGGLMSYSSSFMELYRQVGIYVARILKGEKPAELPVMQPTKFELVINLKTAKALGLTIPPSLLARADEVID